ncbi:hypothetical protein ACOME3_005661 [Neoechinorhynchus agilis]
MIKSGCQIRHSDKVDPVRVNRGQSFLRDLTTISLYDVRLISRDRMCDLTHFLLENARISTGRIAFIRGMFVIDNVPSNVTAVFANLKEKTFFIRFPFDTYFNKLNKHKQKLDVYRRLSSHFSWRNTKTYPAFGIDFKRKCTLNNYGTLLFGQLPNLVIKEPQATSRPTRIYFKPEVSGLSTIKSYLRHSLNYIQSVLLKLGIHHNTTYSESISLKPESAWTTVVQKCKLAANLVKKFGLSYVRMFAHNCTEARKLSDELVSKHGNLSIGNRINNEIVFDYNELMDNTQTCES